MKRVMFPVFMTFLLFANPVYADINSDIVQVEEELGIDNTEKKLIERISYVEEELGITPSDDVSISDRINALKSELGIDTETDNGVDEEAEQESENSRIEESDSGDTVKKEDIVGTYIERDHGLLLRIENDYCYYVNSDLGKYCFKPFETTENYDIEGHELILHGDEEGFDSFEIQLSADTASLVNDKYTFISEDEYYRFDQKGKYAISEKAVCNRAALTVTGVSFLDEISIHEFLTDQWVNSGLKDQVPINPPEGKCYMEIDVSIENLSKAAFNVEDVLAASIVYDSSYVFRSYDEDGNSIVAEPMLYIFTSQGGSNGNAITLSPLSSRDCKLFMLCPTAVRDNTDRNLLLAFNINEENDIPEVFVYDLHKGSSNAGNEEEPGNGEIEGGDETGEIGVDNSLNADTTIKNAFAGNTIKLGSYEQDNDTSNGTEPLEWVVLDKTENAILVLSKYVIDAYPYMFEKKVTTWEESDVRKWLNSDFINAAFTSGEQTIILDSIVPAEDNPEYGTSAGNETQDKMFYLSANEVLKYFPEFDSRICKATAYAYEKTSPDEEGNVSWQMRTPGMYQDVLCSISRNNGVILGIGSYEVKLKNAYGGVYVDAYDAGVRPAMWVSTDYNEGDLESENKEEADTAQADTTQELNADQYMTLEIGSNGDEVVNLQKALQTAGCLRGRADGAYGNGTAGSVSYFQEREGLEPTGIADGETQARLFAMIPTLLDFNQAPCDNVNTLEWSLSKWISDGEHRATLALGMQLGLDSADIIKAAEFDFNIMYVGSCVEGDYLGKR